MKDPPPGLPPRGEEFPTLTGKKEEGSDI